MKTILLKKKFILILSVFFVIQTSFSQNVSNNDSANDEMQSFRLEFNNVDGPEIRRELQLSFSENTTDGFDEGYDTKNLEVSENDLNLILDEELMLTQAFAPITEDKTVPLVLHSSGSYYYTIQLTSTENMGTQSIQLRDNLTGGFFDLRNGDAYEFASEEGVFHNRFEILFKSVTLSQTSFEIKDINLSYANDINSILVSNPTNQEIKSIEMYNVSGQRVFLNQTSNTSSTIQYQISNLNTGIYILKLVTRNNGLLTKKIIAN